MRKRRIIGSRYDDLIREHYPQGGADACKAAGVKGKRRWIQQRASRLGVTHPLRHWTTREDKILREFYPTEGLRCLCRFANKDRLAVTSRAHYLGIKRDPKCKAAERRKSIVNQCRSAGIGRSTYWRRRSQGMDHLEALMTPVNIIKRRASRIRHGIAA